SAKGMLGPRHNRRQLSTEHPLWTTSRSWRMVVCSVRARALGAVRAWMAAVDWSMPAEEVARKIVAIGGPGAAAVTFNNASSLSAADVAAFQRVLIERLKTAGVNVAERSAAALEVKITVAESMQGYVFVAQVLQGRGDAK